MLREGMAPPASLPPAEKEVKKAGLRLLLKHEVQLRTDKLASSLT